MADTVSPLIAKEAARVWVRPPARWILPVAGAGARALEQSLGIPTLAAEILANRGLCDPLAAREFLSPQLSALLDPMTMLDMDRAVKRLSAAVRNREPILLYGDYDVDGTSSIVVLKKALEILGATVTFHVPHRLKEGYGMRTDVIERAAADGVRLVVSVDTGIRAAEVVRHANSLGIDVIVTDHHLPDAALPPALAVLNPNRPGCPYPNKHLCGAGVAFKLVQALMAQSGLPLARQTALLESFLKPVAIATVADIVPLTGENRIIVHRGLSGLGSVRNPGLRSLLAVAGFDDGECPSAHQVAFRLAPRINAAGRMASASDVIELFLTTSPDRARELAQLLDTLNRERQQVENDIVEQILKECEQHLTPIGSSAMVFAGAGWHLGVLGIVASRLVERFSRPVFVLSDSTVQGDGGIPCLTGSGRSIPAFHLLESLESMAHLFTRFGGHRQAAGLTLPVHCLEQFRTGLAEFAGARLNPEDLRPEFTVDAAAGFQELTGSGVGHVLALGPFGFGNPAPILMAEGVEVAGPPKTLKDGKHYNVPLRDGDRTLFCKAWNFGERSDLFAPGTKLDILFQIEDDPYSRKRGYGSWRLTLKDARRSISKGLQ